MIERDHDDTFKSLGGNHSPLLVDSARALLKAGLGGAEARRRVREADEQTARDVYADRHLSGVAERTAEQDANLQDFKVMHLADQAIKAVENGLSATEVAARTRAREERRKRGY